MSFFDPNRLDQIKDAIISKVGYGADIRNILFANINPAYTYLLPVLNNPLLQLINDLNELNDVKMLSDGTVPFRIYLDQAGRILKPFPDSSEIIQKSVSDLSHKTLKTDPVSNPQLPSQPVVEKMVQEKIILKNDMVYYQWLEQGFLAGISVGLIKVPRYDNEVPKFLTGNEPAIYLGTGWLIGAGLVITNHHVINARDDNEPDASNQDFTLQGNNASIVFEFNSKNAAGITVQSVKLEAFDKALDYSIFRLANKTDRKPLRLRAEKLQLNQDEPQVVNIIQHPMGEPKKVALRNNHIYESKYPTIRYFTDTDFGTSGSPVLDDTWQVVGLHRAGAYVGQIQYNGQSTAWVNEGVQIKAIMEHLSSNYPALLAEING
jgi:endonuclease G, mitochondrial